MEHKKYILKEEFKIEEIKNEETTVEEIKVVEVEDEKNGFLSKAKDCIKKHGKKVVVGTTVAVAGLVGYAIGSMKNQDFDSDFDYDCDCEPELLEDKSNEESEN